MGGYHPMMTLTGFVLARQLEDERMDRQIGLDPPRLPAWMWAFAPRSRKRSAAARWASHPDYRPEWR